MNSKFGANSPYHRVMWRMYILPKLYIFGGNVFDSLQYHLNEIKYEYACSEVLNEPETFL